MLGLPTVLPFICAHCFTQYDTPTPTKTTCSACIRSIVTTIGWQRDWSDARCRVLRECLDSAAWIPSAWLEQLAAEHFVEQEMLERSELKAIESLPHPKTNICYKITYRGSAFLTALDDAGMPRDVSTWHRGGVALISLLGDNLAQIRDGVDLEKLSGPIQAAELTLELLQALVREGRNIMLNQYPYDRPRPETTPTTIQSRL